MSKTKIKFSSEVRERAVHLVLDNKGQPGFQGVILAERPLPGSGKAAFANAEKVRDPSEASIINVRFGLEAVNR
ncbi:hypothetical protein [Thalassovita sp.]|uniref:hypothetical protein n=1 Tax=Thalassovita sp. TaxID=1979401 RepID=UPI002AB28828|nr:hypothetical protein [Thalassovita sp.]